MPSNPKHGRATVICRAKAGNSVKAGNRGTKMASRGRLLACQDGHTVGPEVGTAQQSKRWMCYLTLQRLSLLLDQQQQQTAIAAAATATAAATAQASQQHQQQQQPQMQ